MLRLFTGSLFYKLHCKMGFYAAQVEKNHLISRNRKFQTNCWRKQMRAFDTKLVLLWEKVRKSWFAISTTQHRKFSTIFPGISIYVSPPTVVFSRHRNKWWCWSSKMFSLTSSSRCIPASCAANLASAALFFATKAAPLVAFAIWIRANLAFWNQENAD